jgi:hypothetical protein
MEALVWPQRRPYKKITVECSGSIKFPSRPTYYAPARNGGSFPGGLHAEDNAGCCGARAETDIR